MLNYPAHWTLASGPLGPAHPTAFADTEPMPADFDSPVLDQGPFREALRGLHVRELIGEDIFSRFFGRRG